ncbi:hypothetical protein [Actinopolymorpha singaporensis]|uniref:MYXO-CTERM domain-containing protein n=1 Tax=Actinopolymorpha singaporensis TaxID=117157 RepID=A0A1H1VWD4_9ACTN|nr:hypothetical protein [Actinopolymorpha singaporensis]SDS88349.1 hypothetical protein SAMN04489717_4212 [Actinopolymorpha singaporensis]
MSRKYLGKVAAGGALASAALFVATPVIASASVTPSTWGGGHKEQHSFVKTFPRWVHPGDEVKIIEVCSGELEYAKVWSKTTGKVELEPWQPDEMVDSAAPDEHGNGDHGEKHFVYVGKAQIKGDARPGRYKVRGDCGYGTIKVVPETPEGPVAGGDGGVTGAGTDLAAGGAAALAGAALGGVFMVRRRRTDGAQA